MGNALSGCVHYSDRESNRTALYNLQVWELVQKGYKEDEANRIVQDQFMAKETNSEDSNSLIRRLGGYTAIKWVFSDFYRRLLSDARVNDFFDGVDMSATSGMPSRQSAFMCHLLTGCDRLNQQYMGRDMHEYLRNIHTRIIREYGFAEEHFDIGIHHLHKSLTAAKIDAGLAREVIDTIAEAKRLIFLPLPGEEPMPERAGAGDSSAESASARSSPSDVTAPDTGDTPAALLLPPGSTALVCPMTGQVAGGAGAGSMQGCPMASMSMSGMPATQPPVRMLSGMRAPTPVGDMSMSAGSKPPGAGMYPPVPSPYAGRAQSGLPGNTSMGARSLVGTPPPPPAPGQAPPAGGASLSQRSFGQPAAQGSQPPQHPLLRPTSSHNSSHSSQLLPPPPPLAPGASAGAPFAPAPAAAPRMESKPATPVSWAPVAPPPPNMVAPDPFPPPGGASQQQQQAPVDLLTGTPLGASHASSNGFDALAGMSLAPGKLHAALGHKGGQPGGSEAIDDGEDEERSSSPTSAAMNSQLSAPLSELTGVPSRLGTQASGLGDNLLAPSLPSAQPLSVKAPASAIKAPSALPMAGEDSLAGQGRPMSAASSEGFFDKAMTDSQGMLLGQLQASPAAAEEQSEVRPLASKQPTVSLTPSQSVQQRTVAGGIGSNRGVPPASKGSAMHSGVSAIPASKPGSMRGAASIGSRK